VTAVSISVEDARCLLAIVDSAGALMLPERIVRGRLRDAIDAAETPPVPPRVIAQLTDGPSVVGDAAPRVVDLMAALEESLAQAKARRAP